MIYLIDDKKLRQKDFGWSEEKLAQYDSKITPLYNIKDVSSVGEQLYNTGNIILYHESFLDFTEDKGNALKQRDKLLERADSDKGLSVVIFSGSQSTRHLDENKATIPVAILYQNLQILIRQNNGEGNLKYLLFGKNPEIEEKLNKRLNEANREIEKDPVEISGANLFIRPVSKYIQNAIKGAKEGKIFNDVSDKKLSEKLDEWLTDTEYDNIFIPLCFGETLSDFNGLRLATHIRCTPTANQTKRLFIYSFVGMEYLFQNEYFNILKTQGVYLIDYSKKAIGNAARIDSTLMNKKELPLEIKKLKLEPPKNYRDQHSIANEWAIHQWATTLRCDEVDELEKLFKNVRSNLYFKYLRTANPIFNSEKISSEKLKIKYENEPKVLLVDDESEKGWFEIFAYLLGDVNDIHIDYLGEGFRSLSTEEVINRSLRKINAEDIDVVILDFRLNMNDFASLNAEDVSSIRLIKEIKKENPGIQIIIFSATSSAENLKALQEAGADGFIRKDVSSDTSKKIEGLLERLEQSLKKARWLKNTYRKFSVIASNCKSLDTSLGETVQNNLTISFELLKQSFFNEKYFNYAYLQLYICIEEFLRLDDIFEVGEKCYLNRNIKVHENLSRKTWKSVLKYHPPYYQRSSYYSYEENEVSQRYITTDFKMSCVLIFLFNQENSNYFGWPEIRDTRNKKAAHPESDSVTQYEVNEIVAFMEEILNPLNFQEPLKSGLNDDIDPTSLTQLQEKFI